MPLSGHRAADTLPLHPPALAQHLDPSPATAPHHDPSHSCTPNTSRESTARLQQSAPDRSAGHQGLWSPHFYHLLKLLSHRPVLRAACPNGWQSVRTDFKRQRWSSGPSWK